MDLIDKGKISKERIEASKIVYGLQDD